LTKVVNTSTPRSCS